MNSPSVIYCSVRKKWVERTPEEEVRQHIIKHLHVVCGAPLHLMTCEYPVQNLDHRADLVLHDREGKPLVLAEFKAPSVRVDEKTIAQLRRYNTEILAPYLLASNGSQTFFWKLNREKGVYESMKDIPAYGELT
ncbi:MAG: type I restriction enzyme HsdR N-terminal domain-containing protein [Bacteroidales bacterium]|nr:type I restriction enzyme HsdR N-terminal domain-containing protein [Bacteroidales bacterium]MDD3521356.1 type I restriction enzyme HsdR N-terminal domain-containing protein [Bacteroidales bacterium]MDD4030255.1 type I restriction enzyme HsdR N-terminal domain-containing protein [Bacteroidales bacterium]MDD4434990.1 type I restriction enzyme HsdR N-terminal domain-containing protein [Bacteroidales bacterium]MDD5732331.1 type I restriction enzyme HsdR N-terminal domain-containing protein [Bac